MNKKLLLTLPLAVSLLALTGCGEENTASQTEASAEQQTQTAAAEAPASTAQDSMAGTSAAAPVAQEGISGIYCHTTETHRTELVALESPAEGKLTFSFSKWNKAEGSNCGTINLIATKTTDGQAWSVSKEDPYMAGALCTLTVKNENNAIIVTGTGDCVQMCGMGQSIDTISYPLSSKIERPATQAEITGLYEGPAVCPQ